MFVAPKTIADRLVDRVDEGLKADIMHWAAVYVRSLVLSFPSLFWRLGADIAIYRQENRMRLGNKKIFHLEAWVVKVMSLYKVLLSVWSWSWSSSSLTTDR